LSVAAAAVSDTEEEQSYSHGEETQGQWCQRRVGFHDETLGIG